MAGYLTDAEILEIEAAILGTADTYLIRPMVYHKYLPGSLDRFQSDHEDAQFEDYDLTCFITESVDTADELKEETNGSISQSKVTIMFHMKYLTDAGLVDSEGITIFKEEEDFFTLQGKRYKVTRVTHDGLIGLDATNVVKFLICNVKGRIANNGTP